MEAGVEAEAVIATGGTVTMTVAPVLRTRRMIAALAGTEVEDEVEKEDIRLLVIAVDPVIAVIVVIDLLQRAGAAVQANIGARARAGTTADLPPLHPRFLLRKLPTASEMRLWLIMQRDQRHPCVQTTRTRASWRR